MEMNSNRKLPPMGSQVVVGSAGVLSAADGLGVGAAPAEQRLLREVQLSHRHPYPIHRLQSNLSEPSPDITLWCVEPIHG